MNKINDNYTPKARQDELVIEGLEDETLVYDLRTHKAHCLNQTAALVWNRCDGTSTVAEMRRALESELGTPVSAEVIWLALDRLGKANLLADRLPKSPVRQGMTRRDVMRRIGIGAAVAIPLVTSILAPTAKAGISCGHNGASCTSAANCCSGICNFSTNTCVGG